MKQKNATVALTYREGVAKALPQRPTADSLQKAHPHWKVAHRDSRTSSSQYILSEVKGVKVFF